MSEQGDVLRDAIFEVLRTLDRGREEDRKLLHHLQAWVSQVDHRLILLEQPDTHDRR